MGDSNLKEKCKCYKILTENASIQILNFSCICLKIYLPLILDLF